MIVHEASLVLRFYRSDGWTREKVAALGPDIGTVTLRSLSRWERDHDMVLRSELDPQYDSEDADFYAVYEVPDKLPSIADLEELGHDVKSFSTVCRRSR